MRNLFLILAVLLIASAAYAVDATVYCTADGDTVTVSYTANGDANTPRAFGLDIQLDNDETIDSVTVLSTDYWVYPGTYGEDPCTPVGDPCDSDDTLAGIDSNGITLEMGSLHSPPEVSSPNAPAAAGDLIEFTVSGDCDVTISGNAARGKVVFYDATNEDDGKDVVYTGCSVSTECFPSCHPDYADWVSLGKPESWCNPRQCHGDADGVQEGTLIKKWVSSNDLAILVAQWQTNNLDADFDHEAEGTLIKKRVSSNDLAILVANWQTNPAPDCLDCP